MQETDETLRCLPWKSGLWQQGRLPRCESSPSLQDYKCKIVDRAQKGLQRVGDCLPHCGSINAVCIDTNHQCLLQILNWCMYCIHTQIKTNLYEKNKYYSFILSCEWKKMFVSMEEILWVLCFQSILIRKSPPTITSRFSTWTQSCWELKKVTLTFTKGRVFFFPFCSRTT